MSNLGGFSEEALQLFQLAASEQHYNFSEEGEVYDFTRCMRADGSFYGTRGSCKKGSVAGAKEKAEPKTEGGKKRRATAEGKAAAKVASRKAAGAKVSDNARRSRLLKEELNNVREKMKGASPDEQNRLLKEASKKADERHRAGADSARPETKKEKKRDRAEVNKMGRTADQLTPQEKAARAARQAAKSPTERLKEGSANNPAVKRREADKAAAAKKTEDMRSRSAERRAADAAGEAKPARKPRATVAETKPKWQEAERAVVDAKKKWQDANRETKGDQSVEARQRRLQAGRELDKAERAAEKAARRYDAATKRESYAKMTPEQKKEEREWRATKKRLG